LSEERLKKWSLQGKVEEVELPIANPPKKMILKDD
jgi:hypothetical protein